MKQSIDILLRNCKPFGDCLIWQGYVDKYGYPRSHYKDKDGKKHTRIQRALLSRLGYDVEGKNVVALCNNKKCLAVKHLAIMTTQEMRKHFGNTHTDVPKKIEQMKKDRQDGLTYKQLAEKYGYQSHQGAWNAINISWGNELK